MHHTKRWLYDFREITLHHKKYALALYTTLTLLENSIIQNVLFNVALACQFVFPTKGISWGSIRNIRKYTKTDWRATCGNCTIIIMIIIMKTYKAQESISIAAHCAEEKKKEVRLFLLDIGSLKCLLQHKCTCPYIHSFSALENANSTPHLSPWWTNNKHVMREKM